MPMSSVPPGEGQQPKDRFEPIKYLTERLQTFGDRKLVFNASPENLPLAREFLADLHKRRHGAESPLVVVDVEELFRRSGEDVNSFSREDIYREALRQLDPDSDPKEGNALDDFQRKADELEKQGKRVGILMTNLDAVTGKFKEMSGWAGKEKLHYFLLGTFRISGRFRLYAHMRSVDRWGISADGALNDTHIVWEEDTAAKR